MKNKIYKIRLLLSMLIGILSALAVFGVFYGIKFLDIQFSPLFQRLIFDFSIAALLLFLSIIILTVIFGRFYCSLLCPFGILQEFIAFVRGKRKNTPHGNYGFKYLIAGLTFGCLIGGSALIIRYIDPYTVFGSAFSLSAFGLVFACIIFALVLFKNRFFCTNICPVGCVLGLISKISVNKLYMDENCVSCGLCANNCPSGCINHKDKSINNETCVKCLKCISVCPKGAIKFGVRPVRFNPKRRDFLWMAGAFGVISAGYLAGLNFTKNITKKIKDIILPAGADDISRMANKCLNCNLCINNCPNKILTKAGNNFPVVHIDYKQGQGYCKYDCNECSKVCPSGAIKKISLNEKQNTRIAMAVVQEDLCSRCGLCAGECPKNAIKFDSSKSAEVISSLCIGCGKCAKKCPAKAIELFAVNKQSII